MGGRSISVIMLVFCKHGYGLYTSSLTSLSKPLEICFLSAGSLVHQSGNTAIKARYVEQVQYPGESSRVLA